MNVHEARGAEIVARIREAAAAKTPLRLIAGGSWLTAGAPCNASERLALGALTGIVHYEPADLTLTARASTTLMEIERATAEHGQWLPLDPFGAPAGTLGATIATASYGPLAAAYGTPRDQVLGAHVITGTGDMVRAGGRVVKNVAGFDLTRLMIGAWGTLGAITEATVRLRARPEVDETIAIAMGGAESLERTRRWLRTSEFTPMAAELLSPRLAGALDIATVNAPVLLLRAGGNAALVRATLAAARTLGDSVVQDVSIWRALAQTDAPGSATFRLSDAPARIVALWSGVGDLVERAQGHAHANLTRGVVRCIVPVGSTDASVAQVRELLAAFPACTRIDERLPAALWTTPRVDATTHALMAGVRRAFDPECVLNRGIQ